MAVPTLRAIVAAGHDVAIVVSAPDKRRGRGSSLQPSPVKAAAEELGIEVTDRIDDVLDLEPPAQLGVVVAFGRLITPHVLAGLPMVNVHFSLLPRWRGAAPLERAILAGDERTGVCLMDVEEGLDTGGVYGRAEIVIPADATIDELRDELVDRGTELVLDALANGLGRPEPQQGEAVYAQKIEPAELEIDWTMPAIDIHRRVRVGGAWTTYRGRRVKVLRTALPASGEGISVPTGTEPIELLEVQPEGRARMGASAWANGVHWRPGERFDR